MTALLSISERRTSIRVPGLGVFVESLPPHRLQFFPDNVSRGGMLFHLSELPPEPGSDLALRIYLPTDWVPLEVQAKLLRTQPDGNLHKVAVQFGDLSKVDQARILRFCLMTLMTDQDYTLLFREPATLPLSPQNELILNLADEGIYGLDLKGRATFVNQAAARMLGYEVGELIGRPIHKLLPHAKLDGTSHRREECPLCAALRDGTVRHVTDEVFWRKDGTAFPVEYATTPIRQRGELVGAVAVFKDVTQRKQLEEQLRQAQKMEAVGRLAGGVSHDFNNLLTIISGYNQLMLGRLDPGESLHRQAEEISKAVERAASLTQQLLAFSRRQVLQPKVLDLNALVSTLDKMLRRLIGEDIDLATVLGPDLGHVKADPGQIEQVVMNLVVNARDALPQGGKLTIETANVDLDDAYARLHVAVRPGPYVMLAVSDTGCGMDAKTQSRIFEPFFTTKEQGTGLGLSTVYGIVKQSGGNIWVYSEPGRGTTFKVYLPRVEEEIEIVGPPESKPVRGSEALLVVEDEEAVRRLVREMLEVNGYTVLEARDGAEALLLGERHEGAIHLMVTDVVMLGMSGRQLAQRLAAVRPEMKVLYTSGYTNDAVVRHGVLDSSMHFLQKPFTPDALARKVRELLDAPAGRDARES